MPSLPSARRPTNSGKAFHSETSTDAPDFQAGMETRLQSCCYLSEYAKKRLIQKHEKPVHDQYSKDLDELRTPCEEAHSAPAEAMDQNGLEEAARVNLHAGLKAVQPAIVRELKVVEDLMVLEYEPLVRKYKINQVKNRLATLKRDKKARKRGKPAMFTRAEVAEADKAWKAKRTASGLPLEGDSDDLEPGEIVREQNEDMDSSTEEEDSGTDSSVEGQFDNNSHDNPIEVDSESEEEEEQDASVNTLLSRRPRNS